LPHRTKMLEALSQLNVEQMTDIKPTILQPPTVVVHVAETSSYALGTGDSSNAISARAIEQFIMDHKVNTEMLLSKNTEGLPKRLGLQKSEH